MNVDVIIRICRHFECSVDDVLPEKKDTVREFKDY